MAVAIQTIELTIQGLNQIQWNKKPQILTLLYSSQFETVTTRTHRLPIFFSGFSVACQKTEIYLPSFSFYFEQ